MFCGYTLSAAYLLEPIQHVNLCSCCQINYSDLASRYGVIEQTPLGNMVEETNNVRLARFEQFHGKTPAARRRLCRMQGGEISVPEPSSNDQVRETLKVRLAEAPVLIVFSCVEFLGPTKFPRCSY